MARPLRILLATLAVGLIAPAVAQSAERYAAVTGTGSSCSVAFPCSLQDAVTSATTNDEVIVAPGTYSLGATPLELTATGLDVHGTPGQPKPRLQTSAAPGLMVSGPNETLSDVRIEHTTGSTTPALFMSSNALVSRVEVTSQGTGCALNATAVIRDSVCVGGSDPFESALGAYVASNASVSARNVTAIGDVGVSAGTQGPTVHLDLDLRNVIARGVSADIDGNNAFVGGTTTITAQNSNFDSYSTFVTNPGSGFTVTPVGSGTNQTAAPLFVNEAGGDYRQAPGSPTIDAGAVDSLTGTTDVAGTPRPQGAAMDIGAYEQAVVAPPGDTTAPQTTITKGPKAKTKKKKAKFKFNANEAGSTFECKLDRGAFEACTSPLKLTRLRKGKHKLSIVATDAAGNADATPATYRWKVKKKRRK